MKALTASALLAVATIGCREQVPLPEMYVPRDFASLEDLRSAPKDLATAKDMRMPADMAKPQDMGPPKDMAMGGDMARSDDMMAPTDDMMAPTDDMMAPTDDMSMPTGDMAMSPPDLIGADLTPPADPSEFIVLRVGDGAAALTGAATAAFLERRKVSDGSLLGTPLGLPTAVSGTNRRMTLGGTATAEGALSRSADGRYVLLGGYDADVGTASVSSSMSAMVNRVIGRLDSAGMLDSSTAGDFFSGNGLRAATSTDGNALWAAGSMGIVYTTFGSTATPTALLTLNARWAHVLSGQLYASSGASGYHGISQIGTGTPTTTTTATLLSGFAAQPMTSHYGFVALDRDGSAGVDTIYVADDRAVASGGGVQRWTLSGTTWNLDGTLKMGLGSGARGLAGFISGSKVVVLVTTAESPPRVVSFLDDGTALAMIPAKPLASAATNTAYRGIALAPQP